MNVHDGSDTSAFVRNYTVTNGRTRPHHVLGLETVLETGPGRPGPGQAEECRQILALCRARRRSVAELAGRLCRPVTVVKILISDLLNTDALVLPVTDSYTASGEDPRPTEQLLAALSAGLRKKWPDAVYPQAG